MLNSSAKYRSAIFSRNIIFFELFINKTFSLDNSQVPIMTSPPTPLPTERGARFVGGQSPSPVWERDLG